jgi:hypothetical protein
MTCVCNNKVVGINCPITAAANRKKKEAAMAKIADNLIVFGDKIDVNALSYKILCKENNERFVYVDSANHFKVKVPDWLNITQTPNTQNWGGTMYDHTNLMNGILIVPFSKKQFKSLDEVERYYITNNQTDKPTKRNPKIIWQGHQAVEKPYNCNGTAFELRYTADGVLYKCKYLLYETTTAYLLAMYTATDKLYYTDIDKFNEFLEYLFPSL